MILKEVAAACDKVSAQNDKLLTRCLLLKNSIGIPSLLLFLDTLNAIGLVSALDELELICLVDPAVLIPACASSSLAFLMMYSAYKLNK